MELYGHRTSGGAQYYVTEFCYTKKKHYICIRNQNQNQTNY